MTPGEPVPPAVAALVIDADQRIRLWSRSAEVLFGYSAAEVVQRDAAMLFDRWPPLGDVLTARRKSGAIFAAAVDADAGESDLTVVRVRDLSHEWMQANAEELADIGLFERDLITGDRHWSDRLYRMFGIPSGQMAPTMEELTDIVIEEDRERFTADLHEAIRTGELLRNKYRIRRADGEVRTLRVRAGIVSDAAGRASRIVGSVLDVTAGENAARDREDLERQLEETRRIASLGRVAATMAHEFNNVMMGIGTFIEVLKRRQGSGAVEPAIRGIENSIRRGRAITDEILRYARASQPVKSTIDVAAWLGDFTAEALSITAGTAVVQSEAGLHIRGDISQLNQVLINLLLNARDAAPPRTPITIAATRASNAGAPAKFVEIVVSDRGSGIPPHLIDRIFDPLFTTKPRGTGLGLAIVHQVIAAHGGSVRVVSEPGAGTEFHLLFPMAESRAAQTSAMRGSLLLVEDDAGVAAGIAAVLGSEGLRVRVATRGEDAMREIESERPDLIIVDLQLRDMPGAMLYDAVAERWPGMPVIFISGSTDVLAIATHLQQAHALFLNKPFDIEQLLTAVGRLLGTK
jgi:PAS domain S-box-containing protein